MSGYVVVGTTSTVGGKGGLLYPLIRELGKTTLAVGFSIIKLGRSVRILGGFHIVGCISRVGRYSGWDRWVG